MTSRLLVMAKSPQPGKVKTRLCPPCSADEAAWIAECALVDTLEAATRTSNFDSFVLALDGPPGPWLDPFGIFTVVAQHGDDFASRLDHAWGTADGPCLQIGMDTPQVTPELLDGSFAALMSDGTDAVLGPSEDGGWWSLGLRRPVGGLFAGIPMSTAGTGRLQRERLEDLGLNVSILAVLRDLDAAADAIAIAHQAPATRVATAVAGTSALFEEHEGSRA